jgi:hypothetical protein
MHQQSGQVQRRLALIRQRATHRQAVAANGRRFFILTLGYAPLDLAHPFDILLELGLGMLIGLSDRLRPEGTRLFKIVELTELVRDVRQDFLHGQADWALGIRHDSVDRHRQGVLDLTQQVDYVVLFRTVEVAGEQDFA